MRKRIVDPALKDPSFADQEWLDLERLAEVEVTSEDAAFPVESALVPGGWPGWRAEKPGEQTLRLLFSEPLRLRRILLEFQEDARGRTQEFVLRWSADRGETFREIVRQQFNFSPPGTAREVENFLVDLPDMSALELRIVPDIDGGDANASLRSLRLA